MTKEDHIIFYDGECGLCQRSISLIAKWDKNQILFFAPLNGVTYKKYFKDASDMTTVMFFSGGILFAKSDAIIEVGSVLGGLKKSWILLKIIPRFIRDSLYDWVAGQRKKVSCVILVKDQRFLS